MRMYRVELTLNQRDLMEFIDQNPGYKALVTAVESEKAAQAEPTEPVYKPQRQVRKRRTKAQMAAAMAEAA